MGEWSSYAIFDIAGVSFGFGAETKTEICQLVDDVDKAYQDLKDKGAKFVTEPKDQPWGVRDATFVDPNENKFVINRFIAKSVKVC